MHRLALLLPLLALAPLAFAEDPATNAAAAVFADGSAAVRCEPLRQADGETSDVPENSDDAILRRDGNSRSPAETFLRVVFFLFELAFVCAAFASLVVPRGGKPPPSHGARACFAVVLFVVATAIEWFCALAPHPILVKTDWWELAFGPFACLFLSFGSPIDAAVSLPLLLIPFFLVFRGIWKKAGKWLPFVLFGVYLLRFTGCIYAFRGF